MALGLIIDGDSDPDARAVDDWIEQKGGIERAFDGIQVEEGAGLRIRRAEDFRRTEKVSFGFFDSPFGGSVWLIVVDLHNPLHYAGFICKRTRGRMTFRIHTFLESAFHRHAAEIRAAIVHSPPPTPALTQLELVAAVTQEVQPQLHSLRADTDRRHADTDRRTMLQMMAMVAFVLVVLYLIVSTVSPRIATTENRIATLEDTAVVQTNNSYAQHKAIWALKMAHEEEAERQKLLTERVERQDERIEENTRNIEKNTRSIRRMERKAAAEQQRAIEPPPNKMMGSEVGPVLPKDDSFFATLYSLLYGLVYIFVVALLVLWCCTTALRIERGHRLHLD